MKEECTMLEASIASNKGHCVRYTFEQVKRASAYCREIGSFHSRVRTLLSKSLLRIDVIQMLRPHTALF